MLETAGLDSAVLDAGIAAQQLQLVNAIVDEDRQYATRLTITRTDNENASESVISTVISWLMKKKVLSKEHCDSFRDGAYSTPDGWKGTTELEQGKTALASKRNSGVPGCVVWAMELDEQDHRLMSLTDCWVLGILPVPTYVTAGYSINGYIEDLGERIAKEESAGRRAELLADFNELRDCASRAANLPAIFQKYFEGIEKVIVFCPNVFELNEIEKMCPRWFSRVNGNVHTYVVHSSNPFGTSEYDGFKEDDDETAIKLLLCVNQLNEGVHIKGVDAVIMVRRTSSPTIFYQQLGRALTAAGNFEPLVIDLVDNFEMIGIEQIVSMMSESYARLSGENDPEELIPPSAFKVIDHEKDARHLAKNLERRLALRSEKLTIDEKIALWKGL